MNFFIRQPAWVLFVVMYGTPVLMVLPLGIAGCTITQSFLLLLCYLMLVQGLWMLALGRFLKPRAADFMHIQIKQLYAAVGICWAMALLSTYVNWNESVFDSFNLTPRVTVSATLAVMLTAAAMISRILRGIELGHPMSAGTGYDYILTLFVAPFGLWVIQPKIHRMLHNKGIDDDDDDDFWNAEP